MLPYNILLQIAAIRAPILQVGNDVVGWSDGVRNKFIVKSAYSVRSSTSTREDGIVWRVVHRHRASSTWKSKSNTITNGPSLIKLQVSHPPKTDYVIGYSEESNNTPLFVTKHDATSSKVLNMDEHVHQNGEKREEEMAKKEVVKETAEEEGEVCRADFPPNFLFGVATSSYQIEGACNEGGRGPSIWDSFSHTEGKIIDGSNGDVAVDHYHRYKEDVDLIHKFGFDAYRFSISWSRIFPDGLGTKVNDEGISFYNNLINALIEKGIRPFATLYHWDLPLHLQESIGGWLDKQIV
ncbi:hypothetical protein V6N12_045747 [Hibiscus sabdariffa]|uniref:Beta-glucosidase n=1 Tax=Hibiscus sabdariffa TaxID=183260 RepID=A0ABR2G3M0_9ROSI